MMSFPALILIAQLPRRHCADRLPRHCEPKRRNSARPAAKGWALRIPSRTSGVGNKILRKPASALRLAQKCLTGSIGGMAR